MRKAVSGKSICPKDCSKISLLNTGSLSVPGGGLLGPALPPLAEAQELQELPGKKKSRRIRDPAIYFFILQRVELGLPNGGISKYSTKIINEKKAILTDRRKTPNPSPPKGYHKREAEASRPWPKPAPKPKSSMSFQVGPLFENKICAISNHYVFV